jgi:hypothetical protein
VTVDLQPDLLEVCFVPDPDGVLHRQGHGSTLTVTGQDAWHLPRPRSKVTLHDFRFDLPDPSRATARWLSPTTVPSRTS